MKPFLASRPLEVVAVDFTVLEPSSDGHENVLIVTDVFTKFTQVFPTRDQRADTTAKILLREWFMNTAYLKDCILIREEILRAKLLLSCAKCMV